jgi:hypothetical protein
MPLAPDWDVALLGTWTTWFLAIILALGNGFLLSALAVCAVHSCAWLVCALPIITHRSCVAYALRAPHVMVLVCLCRAAHEPLLLLCGVV